MIKLLCGFTFPRILALLCAGILALALTTAARAEPEAKPKATPNPAVKHDASKSNSGKGAKTTGSKGKTTPSPTPFIQKGFDVRQNKPS